MIGIDVALGGHVGLPNSDVAAFRQAVARLLVPGGFGDATLSGLMVIRGYTQGRPAWRRPTLGFGTQSRWDWGGEK